MKVYFVFIVFRFRGLVFHLQPLCYERTIYFFHAKNRQLYLIYNFLKTSTPQMKLNFFSIQRWFIAELNCILLVTRVLCSKALYICSMSSSPSLAVLICSVPV